MAHLEEPSFSAEVIAEVRSLIAQTLAARGIRMEESQLDIAMRRLLLHARTSGKPPIVVAREMVAASAPAPPSEDR